VKYANLSATPPEPNADFSRSPSAADRSVFVRWSASMDIMSTAMVASKRCARPASLLAMAALARSGVKKPATRRPAVRSASTPGVTLTTHGGIVTPGRQVTCGRRGCQTVPSGCHAVRGAGGGGLGGPNPFP